MSNVKFKGFRQVTKDFFDELSDAEKVGFLWFVRSNIVSGETEGEETYEGDIYLGTRCYGHHGSEAEELERRLEAILYNAGIFDESGNTIDIRLTYLTKEEAEDTYVKQATLFNEDTSGQDPLGILVIDGNDTGEI